MTASSPPEASRAADGPPPPITASPVVGPGQWLLQRVYDLAIGLTWLGISPLFLLGGLFRPRLARKALSLSTVGLPELAASRPGRPRVLVHGVSVGEIKAAQSIVAALRERYEVVVSAFSDTGLEVARQLFPDVTIVRYPFDFLPLVRRFWSRIRPDHVLLMELEAWPCFLREANRRGAPVAVVSGRITEESFRRYRMFGSLPEFGRISLFAAQDDVYAERFRALAGSGERVVVTGNVKIDGLRPRDSREEDPALEALRRTAGLSGLEAPPLVVVAGSTHEPEEALFLGAALGAIPGARLVIVPRHPERGAGVAAELSRALEPGGGPQLLSQLRRDGSQGSIGRPLIVDTIGELERLYGLADLVFIGGSLIPHGGQNMMEPAAQGRPVIYGPHVQNFAEETTLLEQVGAALRVTDEHDLSSALERLAGDEDARRRMGEAGRAALLGQRGATGATLAALAARCGLSA
ncbi:MAG: glycosyltransferase N-terminal domain-containing protein [Planctomycetota bacterium]|nr:glycosyltransferase N-terminal domain-containing protein [Planctomycetota bacterium]